LLQATAAANLAVVARGTGTKLTWGAPPHRADLVVDLSRMDQVIEHSAGDLIVAAQAGLPLATLREALRPAGQRLAIDPVAADQPPGSGTLGGLIATGASGPLRLSSGGVRDLLIGVTIVRADGVIAKAGGKVVKNVAGYDLGKLLTGSWGTLGVITEAVFRLNPIPPAGRWVVAPVSDPVQAGQVVQLVLHSQLVASAVEVDRRPDGSGEVGVLLEGIPDGVDGRVKGLHALLGPSPESEAPPPWWGQAPWTAGEVGLRLTTEISALPRLLEAVERATASLSRPAAVRGSAGVGVLHAGLPADDPDGVAAAVSDLRSRSREWGGDVVVLDAPPAVKAALDVWGPVRGLDLMRRIKDQFDPGHRLAPGRFVAGL
jgi:glycolate oxidase FAD binding subunit